MGSARDAAVKGYIRLPKAIRARTDPIMKNRGKLHDMQKRRAEKGKQTLKGIVKGVVAGKRRRTK